MKRLLKILGIIAACYLLLGASIGLVIGIVTAGVNSIPGIFGSMLIYSWAWPVMLIAAFVMAKAG